MKKKIAAAMLALGLFTGLGATVAPEANAYSNWCITHLNKMSGPGLYERHTTGDYISGTYWKLTIIEKLAPAGYWYVDRSYRRWCY
jgi:hypothetical protein